MNHDDPEPPDEDDVRFGGGFYEKWEAFRGCHPHHAAAFELPEDYDLDAMLRADAAWGRWLDGGYDEHVYGW